MVLDIGTSSVRAALYDFAGNVEIIGVGVLTEALFCPNFFARYKVAMNPSNKKIKSEAKPPNIQKYFRLFFFGNAIVAALRPSAGRTSVLAAERGLPTSCIPHSRQKFIVESFS